MGLCLYPLVTEEARLLLIKTKEFDESGKTPVGSKGMCLRVSLVAESSSQAPQDKGQRQLQLALLFNVRAHNLRVLSPANGSRDQLLVAFNSLAAALAVKTGKVPDASKVLQNLEERAIGTKHAKHSDGLLVVNT